MEVIALEMDCRHFSIGDLDTGGIAPVVNLGMNLQSFARRSSGDQTDDHLQAGKWLSAPILADKGEQSVFDLVPFAGSRREVAHGNGQTSLISQPLQFQFPQTEARSIAASAIRSDKQFLALGYLSLPIAYHQRRMVSTANDAVS